MTGFDRATDKDFFSRDKFEHHIIDALICDQHANEVVVGLVGEWGSGKSSVLKSVKVQLDKKANVKTFFFQPWQLDGRETHIKVFLEGLAAASSLEPISKINIDGLLFFVGGAAEVAQPGLGSLFSRLRMNTGNKGFSHYYNDFIMLLKKSKNRIVVIVDELDRLTDDEIQAIFKMFKAIGDLPNVSYLLAYDKERIEQALADVRPVRNGSSYLEKIVQLELRIPYLAPSQANKFLEQSIVEVSNGEISPLGDLNLHRFYALLSYIVPYLIKTPRDIKRLTQTWYLKWNGLRNEVDWLDLLAFCLLEQKLPEVIGYIRQDPGAFASDGVSRLHSHHFDLAIDDKIEPSQHSNINQFETFIGKQTKDDQQSIRGFLELLFPNLGASGQDESLPREKSKSIRNEAVLYTVLTYGQPDQTFLLETVRRFVSQSHFERSEAIKLWIRQGELGAFFDRLCACYSDLDISDHLTFWQKFAAIFEDCTLDLSSTLSTYELVEHIDHRFSYFMKKNLEMKSIIEPLVVHCLQDRSFNLISGVMWELLYMSRQHKDESDRLVSDDNLAALLVLFKKQSLKVCDERQDKIDKVFSPYFFILVHELQLMDIPEFSIKIEGSSNTEEHIVRTLLAGKKTVSRDTLDYLIDIKRLSKSLLAQHKYHNLFEDPKPDRWDSGSYLAYRKFLKIVAPDEFDAELQRLS